MTPEQLRAVASDRNATVACNSIRATLSTVTTVYLVLDRGVLPTGGLVVGADCSVALQAAP